MSDSTFKKGDTVIVRGYALQRTVLAAYRDVESGTEHVQLSGAHRLTPVDQLTLVKRPPDLSLPATLQCKTTEGDVLKVINRRSYLELKALEGECGAAIDLARDDVERLRDTLTKWLEEEK